MVTKTAPKALPQQGIPTTTHTAVATSRPPVFVFPTPDAKGILIATPWKPSGDDWSGYVAAKGAAQLAVAQTSGGRWIPALELPEDIGAAKPVKNGAKDRNGAVKTYDVSKATDKPVGAWSVTVAHAREWLGRLVAAGWTVRKLNNHEAALREIELQSRVAPSKPGKATGGTDTATDVASFLA